MTRDVRELWDTAFFEDIEVDLTPDEDNVRLRILVRERPSVKEVKYKGNKELDATQLRRHAIGASQRCVCRVFGSSPARAPWYRCATIPGVSGCRLPTDRHDFS